MPSLVPAVSTGPACQQSMQWLQGQQACYVLHWPPWLTLALVDPEAPCNKLLLMQSPSGKALQVCLCVPATLAVPDADLVRAPSMAEVSRGPSVAALLRQLASATVTHQMHLGMHGDQRPPAHYQPIACPGPPPCCSKAAHQAKASHVWCCKLQDMHRASPSSKTSISFRCWSQHPG